MISRSSTRRHGESVAWDWLALRDVSVPTCRSAGKELGSTKKWPWTVNKTWCRAGAQWRSHACSTDLEQQAWDVKTYNYWLSVLARELNEPDKTAKSGLGVCKALSFSQALPQQSSQTYHTSSSMNLYSTAPLPTHPGSQTPCSLSSNSLTHRSHSPSTTATRTHRS